ncbi:MAG TPA: hypothetical protein VN680_08380 [Burkholderiaceae bacterium]|nr:hypothetical protein [Burkholderiaceae bacterium]
MVAEPRARLIRWPFDFFFAGIEGCGLFAAPDFASPAALFPLLAMTRSLHLDEARGERQAACPEALALSRTEKAADALIHDLGMGGLAHVAQSIELHHFHFRKHPRQQIKAKSVGS